MRISRVARPIVALLAGAWLYQAAVVIAGGHFAAIVVPKTYFEFFGREHSAIGHALLHLVLFSLPVTVLVAGGTLAAAILLGTRGRFFSMVFVGMLACCAFWFLATVLHVHSIGGDAGSFAAQLLHPSWSNWLALFAPWMGFAFALWASRRLRPPEDDIQARQRRA